MPHFLLASEFIIFAGAGSRIIYSSWRRKNAESPVTLFPEDKSKELLNLQTLYGYNEHSLVGISSNKMAWFDSETGCGISYTEHGKVWLVAGETLGAEENLLAATQKFLQTARENKKIVAFLPATEKFALIIAAASQELKAVKIGAAPYFDLQNWNPRGNKAKNVRSGLNQARRSNICVREITEISESFQTEISDLCRIWLKTRPSILKFGWLFELSPFQNAEKKKFFTARNAEDKLVGFLAASPIPAREGWYLEDVLRAPDAPNGTADLLVFETMKILAAKGAKVATLGTTPLAQDGEDTVSSNGNFLSKQVMNFSRKYLNPVYNFRGLKHFKAKFVPTWWESEYVLAPKGIFVQLLITKAFLYTILSDNFTDIWAKLLDL